MVEGMLLLIIPKSYIQKSYLIGMAALTLLGRGGMSSVAGNVASIPDRSSGLLH